jgi:peptidoglycan/LPS O-acetylase OafA/YrhL
MKSDADRLHHLDALRALTMVLILPAHALALIGLQSGWNDLEAATFWTIHVFRLPLFFLVAGFFAALLLEARGLPALLRNRAVRIGVPLTLGSLLVVPVLTILLQQASTLPYAPEVHEPLDAIAHPQPSYLWFLWYLTLIYAVALVVRRALAGSGQGVARLKSAAARVLGNRFAPLLLALPTACLLYRQPTWMASSSPAESFVPVPDLLAYSGVFFASGWAMFATPGLRATIERRPGWHLLLAALTLPPALALYLLQGEPTIGQGRWFHLLALALLSAATWSLVFGLLGLSRRHLKERNPRLRYWADASYWIYLSHFVPMTALAVAILAVQIPGAVRLILLAGITLTVVYAAYGAGVRYSPIGRVLHGPRPQPGRMRQRKTAGVGSIAPAKLIARTRKA